jgi:microcystin-dependent protein
MKLLTMLLALIAGTAWQAASAVEGTPTAVHYQGSVLDAQGAPLAPTTPTNYKIEFRLWSAITAGTLIWSEEQLVTVFNGQFSVRLGEGTAIAAEPNNLATAFAKKSRFIGITVAPSATEIAPRLAFLSAPYAFVAGTVTRVSQQPGTVSNMRLSSVGYDTRVESNLVSVALTLDKRTNLISAGIRGTVAQLPIAGGLQEVLVAKMDDTDKVVVIAPPGNGKINGSTAQVRLKAMGESVTLQNIGGDDWWIVKDTRDNTPVGTIISYGATNPPAGYLPCDGQSLLRDDHPDLFAAVGVSWGSSSEASKAIADANRFNLPDLSGRFVRGVDPISDGADDDAGYRTALVAGGKNGRNIGTYQLEEMFRHKHGVNEPGGGHGHIGTATISEKWTWVASENYEHDAGNNENYPKAWGTSIEPGGYSRPSVSGSSVSIAKSFTGITQTEDYGPAPDSIMGNETRPVNAAVRYCIKY